MSKLRISDPERVKAETLEHVAWLCFKHSGDQPYLKLCDSDTPGAFKVYRHPEPDPEIARLRCENIHLRKFVDQCDLYRSRVYPKWFFEYFDIDRKILAERINLKGSPEAWTDARQVMDGWQLIAEERTRQKAQEGWTSSHDDDHECGELAKAAECYIRACRDYTPEIWPWEPEWWKPSNDHVRNLVKAGALIAAEIDRLNRIKRKSTTPEVQK